MKKIAFGLLIMISTFCFSQEQYFYTTKGDTIKKSEGTSVNEIFEKYYPEYKTFNVFMDRVDNSQGNYEIIYQKFSYKPLFLIGFLTKKDKKELDKIINLFNNKFKYRGLNIDKNYLIEYDIKAAIQLGLYDSFFIETLGKPNNSLKNSDDYKVYNYKGSEKSFDLIFKDGVVIDYRIYNGI